MSATKRENLHIPDGVEKFPDDWKWERLDDVCDGIFDCHHSTPELVDVGPFVIRSQDIITGVLNLRNAGRVSEETYQYRISRAEPIYGDILYSREGTYFGIAAEVPPNTRLCLGQRMVLIRPDKEQLHPRFVTYWLNSQIMSRHITGFRDGTVAERLNMSTIRALPIPLPPLEEQRAIAHILGSLDDKIEANRRMNETLEASARAIFKSWFVDFDPVHYQSRGETPPGMDAETAALFPDSFEESALGLIPRGWEVGRLDEAIDIIGGGTPKTSIPEYWDGAIPWFSVKDVPAETDVFVIETEKRITQAGVNNSSAKVLPELTTIISARGTVGKLALTGVEMAMNQSCYAVRGLGYPDFFTYFHLKTRIAELQQQTHGTVFDTITRNTFSNLLTVLPHQQVAQRFDAIIEPMLEQIRNNVFETGTLAETRDALLPKLVSGEVRVGEFSFG